MDNDEYLNWIKKYFTRDISSKSDEWVDKLLLIYKDHLNYGREIDEVTSNFFVDKIDIKGEELEFLESDEIIPKVIDVFKDEISKIDDWNVESINLAINNVKEKTGAKGKLLYMPIRIKASGFMHGPELADTLYLIGKDTIIGRL